MEECKIKYFDIIVAIDEENGIGKNNTIPWRNKQDLLNFKTITIGNGNNAIVMGRKTYESLPKSMRPLPNRRNIVITTQNIPEVETVSSLPQALTLCANNDKIFVIGGTQLYEDAINNYSYLCNEVIISLIKGKYNCDTFFPYEKVAKISNSLTTKVVNDIIIKVFVINPNNILFNEYKNVEKHPEYQYLNLLREILENGENRGDRTGTGTKSLFGKSMIFDLRDGFPLITTKNTWFKGIILELLFFISGKTDTKILESQGVNIWKGNTTIEYLQKYNLPWREGDMGPLYSFQWRHAGAEYTGCDSDYNGKGIDQLQNTIDNIKKDPFGRRHIISAWDVTNIKNMALPPCHCFCHFYVGCDEFKNPKFLDCILYQRSGDMFLGVPFNIASYALLMSMIAHITGLVPRKLIHHLGDSHIYLNHIDQVKEQLTRTPMKFPQLSFNKLIENIDNFTIEDINLENYSSWPSIAGDMSI